MTTTTPVLDENIIVDRSPEMLRGAASVYLGDSPIRIRMVLEDMTQATRGDGNNCPLARMLKRACSDIYAVNLSGESPTLTYTNGVVCHLRLPEYIIRWIGRFDRGEQVEPVDLLLGE